MNDPSAPNSARWYYRENGTECGPFDLSEMQFLRDRGRISRGTEVRQADTEAWRVAGACEDLFRPQRIRVAPAPQPERTPSGDVAKPATRPAPEGDGAGNPGASAGTAPGARLGTAAGIPPMPPARGPLPSPQPADPEADRWKKIGIGAGIGAFCALMLLLFVFLCWWLLQPDDRFGSQNLAQNGAGQTDAGGSASGGGPDAMDDAPSGPPSEIIEEDITEEALAAAAAQETGESTQPPPRREVVPEQPFGIQALTPDQEQPAEVEMPAAGGTGGGGGLGSLGELNSRLEREGAGSGEVQISLIWDNSNDLDLHVICPNGERIYYQNKSACGGQLDVDMNATGGALSNEPVENIYWPEGAAPRGAYRVLVHHYERHGGRDPTAFQVVVSYDGVTKRFSGSLRSGDPMRLIYDFER